MLILWTTSSVAFEVQTVEAIGTIYNRAEGSIDPSIAPIQRDGDLYTFTGNIYDSIVVERNSIVVDGAGYTVTGSGSGNGTTLTDRSNVTVRNMTIKNFEYGILLSYSSNNNTLSANNVTANNRDGIKLDHSSDNSIFHNSFVNNTSQVHTEGSNNIWDDGYPSGGNYWSDYDGTDSNHDDIGDTP